MATQVKNPNYNPLDPNSKRFVTVDEATVESQNKANDLNDTFSQFGEFAKTFDPLNFFKRPEGGASPFPKRLEDIKKEEPTLEKPTGDITPAEDTTAITGVGEGVAEIGGTAEAEAGKTTDYTIQQGDTLNDIAQRFGTDTATLAKINNISDPNQIAQGAVIKVTGIAPAGGDVISGIGAGEGEEVIPGGAESIPQTGEEKTDKALRDLAGQAGKAGLSLKDYMSIVTEQGAPTAEESAEIRNKLGIPDLIDERFGRPSKSTVDQYRELYNLTGLGDVKNNLKEINDRIAQKRDDLVKATGEIKNNPWISSATRRGRLKNLQELAFADISNDLDDKTNLLDQYDLGVDEVERQIGFIIGDEEIDREVTTDKLNFLLSEAERDEELVQRSAVTAGLREVPEFLRGVEERERISRQQAIDLKAAGKETGVTTRISELDPASPTYMNDVIQASQGGKSLTGDSIKSLRKTVTVLGQISDISGLLQKEDTGPVLGALKSNNPYDVTAQLISAGLTSIIPNLARGVYGEVGVLTDRDVELYRKTLPNLRGTKELNRLLTAMTVKTVMRGLEDQLEIEAGAGRDVSGLENIYDRISAKVRAMEAELGVPLQDDSGAVTETVESQETTDYLDTLDLEG